MSTLHSPFHLPIILGALACFPPFSSPPPPPRPTLRSLHSQHSPSRNATAPQSQARQSPLRLPIPYLLPHRQHLALPLYPPPTFQPLLLPPSMLPRLASKISLLQPGSFLLNQTPYFPPHILLPPRTSLPPNSLIRLTSLFRRLVSNSASRNFPTGDLSEGNLPTLPTGQLYTRQVHLGIRKASIGEDLLLHFPPDVGFIEADSIVHVQALSPILLSIAWFPFILCLISSCLSTLLLTSASTHFFSRILRPFCLSTSSLMGRPLSLGKSAGCGSQRVV